MKITLDEFSEMLERNCFNAWRSVIGRDNVDIIESVNSVLFTRSECDGKWVFSFALRIGERWHQAKTEMERIEYDPYDPPPFDDTEGFDPKRHMSPQNIASEASIELLTEVGKKVGVKYERE